MIDCIFSPSIPWTNASTMEGLKIPTRLTFICQIRALVLFGYIVRRKGCNLQRLMILGDVQERRPDGRSQVRWSDHGNRTTNTNALKIAQNRSEWMYFTNDWTIGRQPSDIGNDERERKKQRERERERIFSLRSLMNPLYTIRFPNIHLQFPNKPFGCWMTS